MKQARGFSLVELLVSVALFSILMLVVGMVFQRGEEQTDLNNHRMIMQENLREALYKMGQEIRESAPSRVTISNGGTTLTFQIPASISNSGTITWSAPIIYQMGGTGRQLVRTSGGQNTVFANDVQGLNFTASGAPVDTILYSVTLQRTSNNGRILSIVSTGEARLRNP